MPKADHSPAKLMLTEQPLGEMPRLAVAGVPEPGQHSRRKFVRLQQAEAKVALHGAQPLPRAANPFLAEPAVLREHAKSEKLCALSARKHLALISVKTQPEPGQKVANANTPLR